MNNAGKDLGNEEGGAGGSASESSERLRGKISSLEKQLREKSEALRELREKIETRSLFEFSEKGLKLKLYRILLEKFSSLINEQGKKTIGEIKGLVNGEDLTIQGVLSELKPENYDFEKHYLNAAKKAFGFVKKEIDFAKADFNLVYWLEPREILTHRVADDEDIAVFLCSLLHGLGDDSASVVIAEMENLSTHAFVLMEFEEKAYFLDATQDHSFGEFSGKITEVLKKYSFKGAKIKRLMYKFNHFEYRQFL